MASKIADLFLRISAQDATGGVFAKLAGQINNDLTGNITRGVFQANLLTQGFNTLANQAQRAVGAIQQGIGQATNIQLEQINAATTFASLTGKKYEEAVIVIENLNNRLAKSAASLPGATQDYKALATTIQDNVLEAFKGLNGAVDLQGYEDTVASISESYGALTAASTKMTGNTALGLTKALSGGSVQELRTIAFFEQNPVILNEIEKRLQELGAKSLRDLDIKARVKLLEDVGKKFITEDFKKQAGESVDGLIQSFKSTLFDPSTGIFGLMKDLDPAKGGTQSAFTAYNDTLKALIGEDGLFGTKGPIAAIGNALNIDELVYLETLELTFNKITDGIKDISGFLSGVAKTLEQGASLRDVVMGNLAGIGGKLGTWLGDLLLNASRAIADAMGGAADFLSQESIGVAAADILGNVVSALGQVDWASLALNFGQLLRELLIQVGRFLTSIDYGALLSTTLSILGQLVSGLFEGLFGAVPSIRLDDLPARLGRFLASLINQLATALAGLDMTAVMSYLINFAGNLLILMTQALSNVNWAAIMPGLGLLIFLVLKEVFKFLVAFVGSLDWAQILQAALNIGGGLLNMAIMGLFNALMGEFDRLRIVLTHWLIAKLYRALDKVEGLKDSVQSAISDLFARIREKIRDVIPFAGGQSSTPATSTGGGGGFFRRILGRADGQIPTALDGLLAAFQQESASAPPGARPVIANSSEFILRPDQAQIFAAGAAMGGGGKTYNFSPTIHLAAGTPESHAREVLRYFEIWLSEHQQASLA